MPKDIGKVYKIFYKEPDNIFDIKLNATRNEMKSLVDSVKNGKSPISFESLILTSFTTICAIESIKYQKSFPISLESFNK